MTNEKTPKANAFASNFPKLSDMQRRPVAKEGELITKIDPSRIECRPQMRKKDNPGFTQESLLELGDDIEMNDQEQPAVIRPHPDPASGFDFLMVAGERRHRACTLKGLLLACVVRDLTDEQAARIQRSENIQREGFTQLEIALSLKEDKERLGTLQAVAAEWNKGLNWVAERLKYLETMDADGAGRMAVEAGITADITLINDLNRLERLDPEAAKRLVGRAQAEPDLNFRDEVRTELREVKKLQAVGSPEKKPKQKIVPTGNKELDAANERLGVLSAQVKALEEENRYLTSELEKVRQQLKDQWNSKE
jgi:ParB family chromosome partitioning protein